MKVTVYLSDGGFLEVNEMDDASALDLKSVGLTERFITLDMDGATVLVNRDHIVRIDFETADGSQA